MKRKQERYYKFSRYLRERFGCTVYKVSVDAHFSCPNKDGKLSREGCIYCDNRAFSFPVRSAAKPIQQQIEEGMRFGRRRYGAQKFMVYFQPHTNTYAPLSILKERYDAVSAFDDVVGIAIGTRPDCIDEQVLDLIERSTDRYEVWIEYGLQSIHDTTLASINRGHTFEDFLKAVALTRKRNIKICAHVIIGLPGESRDEVIATASELARLKIDAVKIHPLHIVKGTKLHALFTDGSYTPLSKEEFVELTAAFLQHLWPHTVIQRIGADCPAELLVAPGWIREKTPLLGMIERRLAVTDSIQGGHYTPQDQPAAGILHG